MARSSEPEYLVCLNCESPCYTFEWTNGKITEIMCMVCGADTADEFMTQEDFDALAGAGHG